MATSRHGTPGTDWAAVLGRTPDAFGTDRLHNLVDGSWRLIGDPETLVSPVDGSELTGLPTVSAGPAPGPRCPRWYVDAVDAMLQLPGGGERTPLDGPVSTIASCNHPVSVVVHAELVRHVVQCELVDQFLATYLPVVQSLRFGHLLAVEHDGQSRLAGRRRRGRGTPAGPRAAGLRSRASI